MFKDYLIIENVLKNPKRFIEWSKSLEYYTNVETLEDFQPQHKNFNIKIKKVLQRHEVSWYGYRSDNLVELNNELIIDIFDGIFMKMFPEKIYEYSYSVRPFFHYYPAHVPSPDRFFHRDPTILAGVIYLSEDPEKNSGTLIIKDSHIIEIENIFNRFVIYNSTICHKIHNGFGNTIDDSRLTLTFFIESFNIRKVI